MNPKKIIFWGAKGQAKVLHELVGSLGYSLIALFDNDSSIQSPFDNIPLFYGEAGLLTWLKENEASRHNFLIAIGGQRGYQRLEIQERLLSHGFTPMTAIHPKAFVSESAKIGKGCQILVHATICCNVSIGDACIINTSASVDHETSVGRGTHIGPGATICGCVSIGKASFIGAGATILPHLKIGANSIIGAGSVVTKDVPPRQIVFGNPARFIRKNISDS